MPSLFIIAHAPLASALRAVALHTFAERADAVAAYDVPAGEDLARYEAEATAALATLSSDQVLVLTDVLGATPANLAGALAKQAGHRALAGVNVPMIWRALTYLDRPIDDLLARAREGALAGVLPVNTLTPQHQAAKAQGHDPSLGHHQ